MLLRLFSGRVLPGREDQFVELLRQGVEREAPAPGLLAFMTGYQRAANAERFVLVSAWDSEASLVASLGPDPLARPQTLDKIRGVAEAESIDHYRLVGPIQRGILDAPGAVLRVSRALVRPGRLDALRAWLDRKGRDANFSQALLGWVVGWREEDGGQRMVGVSAWASPLQVEAIADAGRSTTNLFAELDDYVTDFEVEVYQAIELRLSPRLADFGGRRLIVARFDSDGQADSARAAFESRFALGTEGGVSVARLAHSGDGSRQPLVFVARVSLAQHGTAERLIADNGGQILYEADEKGYADADAAPSPAQ